ncbi:MAG: GNAT family N-acetyltransferase [Spirochaetaceae bacterium]|jgi:ribosomal protein S18 acetylase RimI-like enzyme|nr:GNAT family N-acetyltransferase [Spirochaetaceae bacterium]
MVREFCETDIQKVMKLLNKSKPYVLAHHEYIYWMLSSFHSETSYVYVESDSIIGFLGGMQSIQESSVFIWQICVDPEYRRKNIAMELLSELDKLLINKNIENIQLSITRGNSASLKLFKKFTLRKSLQLQFIKTVELSASTEDLYKISK